MKLPGQKIVAGAEDVLRVVLRHDELGNRAEPHAAPMIVETAPRRDAVKVADVFDLRQRHELRPVERHRVLDEAADLELPLVDGNVGLLAEIEHRPVLHQVLANGHDRHAVPVAGSGAFGLRALKPDVDGIGAHLALPLDVSLPALDNLAVFGICHVCSPRSSSLSQKEPIHETV